MKQCIQALLAAALLGVMVITFASCGKATDAAALSSANFGVGIDDNLITSRVKASLLADPDTRTLDLKVDTRQGEVTLSGYVDSQIQLDRVTATTLAISGVKAIQNNVVLRARRTS
jgi:hyperosmotically inducible periplasmic protein